MKGKCSCQQSRAGQDQYGGTVVEASQEGSPVLAAMSLESGSGKCLADWLSRQFPPVDRIDLGGPYCLS